MAVSSLSSLLLKTVCSSKATVVFFTVLSQKQGRVLPHETWKGGGPTSPGPYFPWFQLCCVSKIPSLHHTPPASGPAKWFAHVAGSNAPLCIPAQQIQTLVLPQGSERTTQSHMMQVSCSFSSLCEDAECIPDSHHISCSLTFNSLGRFLHRAHRWKLSSRSQREVWQAHVHLQPSVQLGALILGSQDLNVPVIIYKTRIKADI